MDSTTSRSCLRGARATPTTSTSPGSSATTASSCRCSPRRWTASSRRPRRAIIGKLGGLGVLNLEGIFTRYEDADEQLERIAGLPKDEATREMQEIYREPIKPELIAQRIAEIKAEGVVVAGVADAAARPRVLRARARRRARHPRHPGHGRLGRARLGDDRAAEPQGVHPRGRRPGRRRRLRQLPHGPAPHAHRRGRRARRRRPRRRVHDARRARHRRPAGDGDRRRRGRPLAAHARDRRVRARSSPTAACAPAATSRRRSPAAPTP